MSNEFPSEELLLEIVGRLNALQKQVDDSVSPEKGWSPTFLTTPYTNTDFDGDSFSDVGSNTKIENTSWSTTIPANAKALLIYAAVRDSGSAGTSGLYLKLYPAAAAAIEATAVNPSGAPNDSFVGHTSVIPCTDGDIWYQVNASGASTMDVYLRCFGYWR